MAPKGPERDPPARRDPPLVLLQFRADATPSWGPSASAEVQASVPDGWQRLSRLLPGLRVEPLFDGVSEADLERVLQRARQLSPRYRPAPFRSMFRLALPRRAEWGPGSPDPSQESVGRWLEQVLREALPVERVQVRELHETLPLKDTPGGDKDLAFLDPAMRGVDAPAAWDRSAGDGFGKGETLADIEKGWFVKTDPAGTGHEALGDLVATLLPGGVQDTDSMGHGTAVLGLVLAPKDGQHVVGVAPGVDSVLLSSAVRTSGAYVPEAAIMEAIVALSGPAYLPGAVLLIELQTDLTEARTHVVDGRNGPLEILEFVHLLIQLAVACHIVVVEAAGNGGTTAAGLTGVDLDAYATADAPVAGMPTLLHGDSGAILVGQSKWTGSSTDLASHHESISDGVTGARIDCFAWGFKVIAASASTSVTPIKGTWNSYFGGTSAAAAIVAGVALVVQGMVRAGITGTPGYLTPQRLRALLRDRGQTPLADGSTDTIGVMPDLAKLIDGLAKTVDVYLRDHVLDTGDRSTGTLSRSPDIIVRNAPLPASTTPDAEFGEASGTAGDDDLSEQPLAGGRAWIYLRLRNRGTADATGVKVSLWYAQSSTLLQPADWEFIDSTVVDVPAGDTLVVAPPIVWDPVPDEGHYCFIALAHHPADPGFVGSGFALESTTDVTVPAEFADFAYFRTYIANENNVVWRNVNVVAAPAGTAVAMAARVRGATGTEAEMELRVETRLPEGARLRLLLPKSLEARMVPPAAAVRAAGGGWSLVLPARGLTRLGSARLPAREAHELRFEVTLPERPLGPPPRRLPGGLPPRPELALVQLHRGQVVGRVTWRLRRGPRRDEPGLGPA